MQKKIDCSGRFENAPAHIIIDSVYYSSSPAGYHDTRDEEYEERMQAREDALLAKQEARERAAEERAIERDKKHKEKVALEAQLREERSQRNKAECFMQKKPREQGPWLDTRRKRENARVPKIRPVVRFVEAVPFDIPAGYVPLQSLAGGVDGIRIGIPALIRAIELGAFPAQKIQRRWYVDEEAITTYICTGIERRRKNAQASLAKARAVRAEKRGQKTDTPCTRGMECI